MRRFVFLGLNPALIRPLCLSLFGAAIIVVRWWQLRDRVSRWAIVPALLFAPFVLMRALSFHHGAAVNPMTFDLYLLYAGQSFGFAPSLAVNHIIESLHAFPLIEVVYESLMLMVAVTYAYAMGNGRALKTFAALLLPAILGVYAYRLMPACGPVYLLGSECYLGQLDVPCANVAQVALVNRAELPVQCDAVASHCLGTRHPLDVALIQMAVCGAGLFPIDLHCGVGWGRALPRGPRRGLPIRTVHLVHLPVATQPLDCIDGVLRRAGLSRVDRRASHPARIAVQMGAAPLAAFGVLHRR